jgi:hypothetical protein
LSRLFTVLAAEALSNIGTAVIPASAIATIPTRIHRVNRRVPIA